VLVSAVIAITLAIQIYWVFKNYEESRHQLERDIRTNYDLSVENYFTLATKKNTLKLLVENGEWPLGKLDSLIDNMITGSETKNGKASNRFLSIEDTLVENDSSRFQKKTPFEIKNVQIFKNLDKQRILRDSCLSDLLLVNNTSKNKALPQISNPSIQKRLSRLQALSDRIVISFAKNEIDLKTLDSIMDLALMNNDIKITNGFKYSDGNDEYEIGELSGSEKLSSDSPQLYKGSSLVMYYSGTETTLFRRNLAGLLLSTVLIATVIFCLFYMLFIIRKQKELSLIKNDLISNITHEFKTPIATASAALEGVQNFTNAGDWEKSNRYLNVGREQLSKLNTMVEKLLETATIDSEKLALQRTRFDLTDLIQESADRYQSTTGKTISTNLPESSVDFYGDEFHLENAVNNLLDNAIKYGGSIISVSTAIKNKEVVISISDNGKQLKAKDTKHLFDKFYRVPQGDTHNIKGYGIGLFYTKAIIEKHGGTISLSLNPTTFKIHLPHE
jgi:two-component system phosphate regulon sensor histidine kinase PhoR